MEGDHKNPKKVKLNFIDVRDDMVAREVCMSWRGITRIPRKLS